jgi:dihydroxyacid dehydratase/phosphogluconate dehydratase
MTDQANLSSGTLAVTNSESSALRLVLEPWADERTMSPGSTVVIAYSGPTGGRMEVERKPGEIVVYGWEGSTMSIVDEQPA